MTSSTSRFFCWFVLVIASASITACAGGPGSAVLHPVASTAKAGSPVNVLVATTRKRSETDKRDFTNERNYGLAYGSYTISVPARHVANEIEWPSQVPGNPATDFVALRSAPLDEASFNRNVVQDANGTGEVTVFVHGYKTSYERAVFRAAQLKHDSRFPEAIVAFAWPSRDAVGDYLTDRESATFSRDYLEQLLSSLARTSGIRRINIIAHSMGNLLAMETLRQAAIRGKSAFLPKLGEVFLMSPDIDLDVFATQLTVISKRNPPITVAISADDEALAVSQWLSGDLPRVGNVLIEDTKETHDTIAQYGLRVINMSDARSMDALNHSKFIELLPSLKQMSRNEARARRNPISRTGLFVFNTAGALLDTPRQLGSAITRQ